MKYYRMEDFASAAKIYEEILSEQKVRNNTLKK